MRRGRGNGRTVAATASAAAMVMAATSTAWAAPTPGAPGVGDSYYPTYGNGGYDVTHYGIKVDYDPASDLLTGVATITAKATQDLSRFDLDFALRAQSVTVDGAPAKTRTDGLELIITPQQAVAKDATMTVVVTYAGVPGDVTVDGYSPWIKTADGAVALGEPQISSWWFPGNDHPRDKATYDVTVTVPEGVEAISNGRLASHRSSKGQEVWRWRENKPMATYLAFMAVGQYDITQSTTPSGLPMINAITTGGDRAGAESAKKDLARSGEVLTRLERYFGPYPFTSTGGVVPVGGFRFALETQTRPVYGPRFWADGKTNMYVVVHEQAHQWYGDSVSVHQWKDIWLNEGFASYAEWLWSEEEGEGSAAELLKAYYATPADDALWQTKIGDPGKDNEFDGAVYDRGAMTLQALRQRIGDPAFWQVMRNWAAQHRYKDASIAQFIALAEKSSGQDLTRFFDNWLYTTSKPAATAENGIEGLATDRGITPVPKSKAALDELHAMLHAEGKHAGR